jgi:hypothetical protein
MAVSGYSFVLPPGWRRIPVRSGSDVQISTATGDLRQLGTALGDIEEFIRGLIVCAPGPSR